MCGITGILYFDRSRKVELQSIAAMRKVALHRGPDDDGTFLSDNIGLGFNRLSIIDLAGGHQPMSNEDGTVWLVFNGEIYNFRELREDLIARGHLFRTRSDTETIVHAWEEYGEACVNHLRGMFGLAIWDERRRVLFLARDRIGIKPLYYYLDRERLAFASELKSLFEVPGVQRDLDPAAVLDFVRHGYVIAPHTMFRSIRKLPPGHCLLAHESGIRIRQYWDVPVGQSRAISEHAAIEELALRLEECVNSHLISDVPLGAFLSGGIDSSCVVAIMRRLGIADIKTFSIGYDDPESELKYAKIVADHFHTDHHELRLTPGAFQELLPKIVWHMDEPVADKAAIPLYLLSQFARRHVTVALSGEGSDELFGGYPIYARMLQYERFNRIPGTSAAGRVVGAIAGDTKIRKYAEMAGRSLEERYTGVGMLFSERQAAKLVEHRSSEEFDGVAEAYACCGGAEALSRMTYVDLKTWLPDDLLIKADRMSMAHSLELRVPFLDHTLIEFAAGLPNSLKVRRGVTKYLLKKWAEPVLPHEIVYRAKKGFPVPVKAWLRGDLAGFVRDTLLGNGAASQFLSRKELENVLSMHEREDRSSQIYALLVFNCWYEAFGVEKGAGAYSPLRDGERMSTTL